MLHHLIKVNNLWPSFEENHLNGDHLKFIEELIKPDEEIPMEKGFLYEVSKSVFFLLCYHNKYVINKNRL